MAEGQDEEPNETELTAYTDASDVVSARHLDLDDLPAGIIERVRFEKAAPRVVRRSRKLPPEARDAFKVIWNGLIGDIVDELSDVRRRDILSRETIDRVLKRLAGRLQQAHGLVIVAGVHVPFPGDTDLKQISAAVAGSGIAAGAVEVAAYGSFGTAASVAVGSAIIGELFENYVASSARTRQYLRAGRSPDPAMIASDLAEALGHTSGPGTSREATRQAMRWLAEKLLRRTSSRFVRGLVPVAGIAIAGGLSFQDVRRVTRVPMGPPSADEIGRMQHLVADYGGAEEPYRRAMQHFLAPPSSED